MKFVCLWTDFFVYTMLVLLVWYIFYVFQSESRKKLWKYIIYKPINLFAMLILMAYCVVGVLDSMHFKSTDVESRMTLSGIVSVFDLLVKPLIINVEQSYSAPFALYSFSKENRTDEQGNTLRVYPRLKYAAQYLQDESQKSQDIKNKLVQVVLQTLLISGALIVLFLMYASSRHQMSWEAFFGKVISGKTEFPWRTFILSFLLLVFFVIFIHDFMPFYHILGTSQVGQDVLYQSLKSIRTGLIIGTLTTLVMLPFAILFGTIAGYFRGWLDDLIQYFYTTLSSIPAVLLIAASVLVMQMLIDRHENMFQSMLHRADAKLLVLCVILGVTSWTTLCRLMRAETLKLSQMEYIQAARVLGVSDMKIILRHILPNVAHIILITITLDFSGLVLAEAVLSYVGVGVDPASYSWGNMINSARMELARMPIIWWSLLAAFIFMFTLVLVANLFADAVREAFDPHKEVKFK